MSAYLAWLLNVAWRSSKNLPSSFERTQTILMTYDCWSESWMWQGKLILSWEALHHCTQRFTVTTFCLDNAIQQGALCFRPINDAWALHAQNGIALLMSWCWDWMRGSLHDQRTDHDGSTANKESRSGSMPNARGCQGHLLSWQITSLYKCLDKVGSC